MKKITVFTATRAEYGLLYWLMKGIDEHPELALSLLVSGTHLSPEFGLTYQQIEDDGFVIDEKVEMLLSSDTPASIAKSMGLALLGYADALERISPDAVVILGDRYEAVAMAQAAMVLKVPVVHLHGGEITEGAYDDAFRHAITKFSSLHFTSCEAYRKRVIQLGEHPDRVFNVGALGLDHIHKADLLSRKQLSEALDFDFTAPFLLFTYHPVTLADEPVEKTFNHICEALDHFPGLNIVMTYPNADAGGRRLIPMLHAYQAQNEQRVLIRKTLGSKYYLSALNAASAVIGNSSSGIIEAAAYKTPAIDIGDRQKGRLRADSVIGCDTDVNSIKQAIEKALSAEWQESCTYVNPYGDGGAADSIISMLVEQELNSVKTFYDLGGS